MDLNSCISEEVFFLDYPVVSYADVSRYAHPFEDDMYIHMDQWSNAWKISG